MNVPLIRTSASAVGLGRRAQTKEQNRRIILDAARQIFSELGYGQTTVRDIIRATSLASGTFYNYFKSKEEVFEALCEETALAFAPVLREGREEADSAEAFVAATFRTFFACAAANRAEFAAINHTEVQPGRPNTREIVVGFEELRQDIEMAIARGLFPALDAELLAAAIIGVAYEIAEALQKRATPDAEAASHFATALIVGGIATLPKYGTPANSAL